MMAPDLIEIVAFGHRPKAGGGQSKPLGVAG